AGSAGETGGITPITEQIRRPCPDCGKPNMLVLASGALRAHGCPGPVDPVEEPAVEATPARREVAEVEVLRTTTVVRAPLATSTHRRRYCRVPNCGRTPRDNGLWVSHRLHTDLTN